MARYENLAIYRKAMQLTVFCEDVVAHFSRYHKYTVGTKLRELAYRTAVLIVKANNRPKPERKELIAELRDTVEEMKIVLNVAHELKAFNNAKSFFNAMEMAADIGRQSEGWLKHVAPTPEA